MDSDNERRRKIAKVYLEDICHPGIVLPKVHEWDRHVWHLFTVRISKRDVLKQFLEANGIQTMIHYPVPPHKQHAFKDGNFLKYPITEQIHETILSLPISPVLSWKEVKMIVNALNSFK